MSKKSQRYHGLSRHRFYGTWNGMMHRCYDTKHEHYDRYGGRGIVVCDEWHKVENFILWCETFSEIPEEYTLDRKNNDKGYSPDNCHFVNEIQQQRNRSSNLIVEYDGMKMVFKEFVEKYGIVSYSTAKKRHNCYGFSLKDAAMTPITSRSERWTLNNPRKKKL